MIFTETIKLSELRPVRTGSRRHVYAVPGHPDLLIKIIPSWKIYTDRWLKRLIRRLLPNTRYRGILTEVECEMQLSLRLGPACSTSPLPKCMGVVSTDLGAGILVEKIVDRSGTLARTLYDLCASNEMDRNLLGHLNELVAKLFDMQIVAPTCIRTISSSVKETEGTRSLWWTVMGSVLQFQCALCRKRCETIA